MTSRCLFQPCSPLWKAGSRQLIPSLPVTVSSSVPPPEGQRGVPVVANEAQCRVVDGSGLEVSPQELCSGRLGSVLGRGLHLVLKTCWALCAPRGPWLLTASELVVFLHPGRRTLRSLGSPLTAVVWLLSGIPVYVHSEPGGPGTLAELASLSPLLSQCQRWTPGSSLVSCNPGSWTLMGVSLNIVG